MSRSEFCMLKILRTKNMPQNRTQNWLQISETDNFSEEMWPLNSSELNPLDYHTYGEMLEVYHSLRRYRP